MKVFGILALMILFACQTVPVEQKVSPPPKKNPTPAGPSLPSKPEPIALNTSDLGCDHVEKLAMVSCLQPEAEIPFPYCEKKDAYAILGVIPFALCTDDVDILIAHLPYARLNYRPSTVGLMKRVIKKMTGDMDFTVTRPLIYTRGLKGRAAMELMTSIWIESGLRGGVFSQPMKDIINQHVKREPGCLFFQYVQDLSRKDFSKSLAMASESKSSCGYYKHYDAETIKIDIYFVQELLRKILR